MKMTPVLHRVDSHASRLCRAAIPGAGSCAGKGLAGGGGSDEDDTGARRLAGPAHRPCHAAIPGPGTCGRPAAGLAADGVGSDEEDFNQLILSLLKG